MRTFLNPILSDWITTVLRKEDWDGVSIGFYTFHAFYALGFIFRLLFIFKISYEVLLKYTLHDRDRDRDRHRHRHRDQLCKPDCSTLHCVAAVSDSFHPALSACVAPG
jgi:hypothetical protein